MLKSSRNGDVLAGCNFWSWAGTATTWDAGKYWKKGDAFVGDPPHELQGWYSIHNDDKNTLEIIRKNMLSLEESRK